MSKYLLSSGFVVDTNNCTILHEGKCNPVVSEGVYTYHQKRTYYRTSTGKFCVLTQQYKPIDVIDFLLCEFFHDRVPKMLSKEYAVELTAQECATQMVNNEGKTLDSVNKVFEFQTI